MTSFLLITGGVFLGVLIGGIWAFYVMTDGFDIRGPKR